MAKNKDTSRRWLLRAAVDAIRYSRSDQTERLERNQRNEDWPRDQERLTSETTLMAKDRVSG